MTLFLCLQVGRFEVNLISPDSKTVVLEKNFKDISFCSQVCSLGFCLKALFTLMLVLSAAQVQCQAGFTLQHWQYGGGCL